MDSDGEYSKNKQKPKFLLYELIYNKVNHMLFIKYKSVNINVY